ncbi:hypothetical protein ACFP1Z_16360 [Streptomyces gamaensis]|uniref:Sigma-like protein n=1 Tax=Streptomyces gamaensis TaxID=1763542 RepID=A0ABW0YYS2_9ACTN
MSDQQNLSTGVATPQDDHATGTKTLAAVPSLLPQDDHATGTKGLAATSPVVPPDDHATGGHSGGPAVAADDHAQTEPI